MRFYLPPSDGLYGLWRRLAQTLIDGDSVYCSRLSAADLLVALRDRGDRDKARELCSWICWIGYPVSDAFLENRYGKAQGREPIRR